MSRTKRIHDALFIQLTPEVLTIDDESHLHHVPHDAESHFKLLIVSKQFEPLKRIERHRLVQDLLQSEFSLGLHALSLHLYTPYEWLRREQGVAASPRCHNGKSHDKHET